jgi:ATP-dependent helicase HrpA
VARECATDRDLALLTAAAGLDPRLFADVADRAVAGALQLDEAGLPATAAQFAARVDAARSEVAAHGGAVREAVKSVLTAAKEARAALATLAAPPFAAGRESIERQLATLLANGWVRDVPGDVFPQLHKYVRAAVRRAQRLREDVARDRRLEAEVSPYESAWRALAADSGSGDRPELERLRWMLEEFRLSLFAQELRTLAPVSARRLEAQLARAREEASGA